MFLNKAGGSMHCFFSSGLKKEREAQDIFGLQSKCMGAHFSIPTIEIIENLEGFVCLYIASIY